MINLEKNMTKFLLATAFLLPSLGAFATPDSPTATTSGPGMNQGSSSSESSSSMNESAEMGTDSSNTSSNLSGPTNTNSKNMNSQTGSNVTKPAMKARQVNKMQNKQNQKVYQQKTTTTKQKI